MGGQNDHPASAGSSNSFSYNIQQAKVPCFGIACPESHHCFDIFDPPRAPWIPPRGHICFLGAYLVRIDRPHPTGEAPCLACYSISQTSCIYLTAFTSLIARKIIWTSNGVFLPELGSPHPLCYYKVHLPQSHLIAPEFKSSVALLVCQLLFPWALSVCDW